VTITQVEVSKDLRHAKVFVSIMGEDEERSQGLQGLMNATGFLRKRLKENLRLRIIPEITFIIDTTLERVQRINDLIRDLRKEQ
jgi:ribosome-binding factor A